MIVTTAQELLSLQKAGRAAAKALSVAKSLVRAGMSTLELNSIIEEVIRHEGCKSAFKKVPGYQWASCISINEEVVHSPPRQDKIIQPGDLVSIDTGAVYNGYFSDTAISLVIPPASEEALALIRITEQALRDAIAAARAGETVGAVTRAITAACDAKSLPIKNYGGHGVGLSLHEPPLVPNHGGYTNNPALLVKLEPGTVVAIEPMITSGTGDTKVGSDGWTVATTDKKLAAHFEHTVFITEQGTMILTEE